MFCLIAAESAIFTIFVVAYLFYIGKSLTGPQPNEVLSVPVFYTICLLSSSLTIHLAVKIARERESDAAFGLWWLLTIALGATFLFGTAQEWHHLIYDEGLTIQHQPVRHHLLLAGRTARLSRHGRPAARCRRVDFRALSGT